MQFSLERLTRGRVPLPELQLTIVCFFHTSLRFLFPLYWLIHRFYKANVIYTVLPLFLYVPQILSFKLGFDIFVFSSIGGFTVSSLKLLCAVPRPYYVSPIIRMWHSVAESTYSFPSNHTFAAAVVSVLLMVKYRTDWWPYVAGVIWTLLVAVSRMSLGVHYPQDLVVPLIMAALMGTSYRWWQPSDLMREWRGHHFLICAAVVLTIVLVSALLLRLLIAKPEKDLLAVWTRYWLITRGEPPSAKELMRALCCPLKYEPRRSEIMLQTSADPDLNGNGGQKRPKLHPWRIDKLHYGLFLAGALFSLALRRWIDVVPKNDPLNGVFGSWKKNHSSWVVLLCCVGVQLLLLTQRLYKRLFVSRQAPTEWQLFFYHRIFRSMLFFGTAVWVFFVFPVIRWKWI